MSPAGDPWVRLAEVVEWVLLPSALERALPRADRSGGGRPPYYVVLLFRPLVLQTLATRSDKQAEYQVRDRLSFMRFVGLRLDDPVPDATRSGSSASS